MKYIVASFLLLSMSSFASNSAPPVEAKVNAVVPCEESGIDPGETITPVKFCMRDVNENSIPTDYVSPKEFPQINGKTVNRHIKGGEILRSSDVTDFAMKKEINELEKIIDKLKTCHKRCDDLYKAEIINIAK